MSVPVIRLQGNSKQMGRTLGKYFGNEITDYIRTRYSLAEKEARDAGVVINQTELYKLADNLVPAAEAYGGLAYEEVQGLSDETSIPIRDILFSLAYSDILDLILPVPPRNISFNCRDHGCTAAIVLVSDSDQKHVITGQTWDMPPKTQKDVVLLDRYYDNGTHTVSLTTVLGQSHIGMNGQGVCIGTNNLATTDTGNGLCFAMLIHLALLQATVATEATEILTDTARLSGHNYYVVDGTTNAINLEVTAHRHVANTLTEGIFVHANHYQQASLREKAIDYSASSIKREEGLSHILNGVKHPIGVDDLSSALSNHDHGICRHVDSDAIVATTAAVIFEPSDRRIYYVLGYPCNNEWETMSVN